MLNPLDMLRELRDDRQLTTTEFAVLAAAVLRADNRTGKVRASQTMLAEDAKVERTSVYRVVHGSAARRYLTIERNGRRLDLFWTCARHAHDMLQGAHDGTRTR